MPQRQSQLYSGPSARHSEALTTIGGDGLQVSWYDEHGEPQLVEFPYSSSKLIPSVGSAPCAVEFEQFRLKIKLDFKERRLWKSAKSHAWLSTIERNRWLVFSTLALTLFLLLGTYFWGLPAISKKAAPWIPQPVLDASSEQTILVFDKIEFEPSSLPGKTQQRLTQQFQRLVQSAELDQQARLIFRSAPHLGANALALPDGTVIVTDQLVELADDDNQILAVLSHELGHLNYLHGQQQMGRSSILAITIGLLTGDVDIAWESLAAAPMAIGDAAYSRSKEEEADDYAMILMDEVGLAHEHFADIMTKLSQGESSGSSNWLSTHPRSEDRIAKFAHRDSAP